MGFIERGPEGATMHAHSAEAAQGPSPLGKVPASQTLFSADGRLLAAVHTAGVSIYDTSTHAVLREIPTPGTVAVHFSPTGKYLIVYQKGNAAGAGDDKNLTVWDARTGARVYECFQKSFNKVDWPYLQFSADDTIAARVVTNEAHFIRAADFAAQPLRLRVPQIAAAKLSPGAQPMLATFIPEVKGQPCSVRIYPPPPPDSQGAVELQPAARKSFFRTQEVEFMWARDGAAVLILGSTDVDVTNQSYFGETSLHFMRTDGALDCKVPLDKDGPVHEAAWSPTSEEFVVVYGFMPAKATIFSAAKCEPKYQLGAGPHNTVRWNPFGRFICLAGFGNLPGDMKFFDRKSDGKYKLVGATRAACSVTAEWSPDGRRLLTATTAPRLNVDNGFKIWRYNGDLLHHAPRDKLYEAKWQPARAGMHADRAISPGSVRKESEEGGAGTKKPGAYRPPMATSGAGNFSAAKAAPEDTGPGKYRAPGAAAPRGSGATSGPPGAAFVDSSSSASKNAAKNAKKRAAAKAKKEAE